MASFSVEGSLSSFQILSIRSDAAFGVNINVFLFSMDLGVKMLGQQLFL